MAIVKEAYKALEAIVVLNTSQMIPRSAKAIDQDREDMNPARI